MAFNRIIFLSVFFTLLMGFIIIANPNAPCLGNNECAPSERCVSNQCKVYTGEVCSVDADCISGDACEVGVCRYVLSQASCTTEGKIIATTGGLLRCGHQIPGDSLKWLGRERFNCHSDLDCGENLFCSSGTCTVPTVSYPCYYLPAYNLRIPAYDLSTSYLCSIAYDGASPVYEVRKKDMVSCSRDIECQYGSICDGLLCRRVLLGNTCYIPNHIFDLGNTRYQCVSEGNGFVWRSVAGKDCVDDTGCRGSDGLFCSEGTCKSVQVGLPCVLANSRFTLDPVLRCQNVGLGYHLYVVNGQNCVQDSSCISGFCNGGTCSSFERGYSCYTQGQILTRDGVTLQCSSKSGQYSTPYWLVPDGGICRYDGSDNWEICAIENSRCTNGVCLGLHESCSTVGEKVSTPSGGFICVSYGNVNQWEIDDTAASSCLLGDYNGDGRVSIQDFRGFRSHVLNWGELSSNSGCGGDTQRSCLVRGQYQCDSGLGFGNAVSACVAHCNIGDFDRDGRVSIQDFRGFRSAVLGR